MLARNWRCPRGELDVVAWRDGILVVCEVKARRNTNFGDPFEAITPHKVLRLRRATTLYMESLQRQVKEIRFDAASVIGTKLVVRVGVL